MIRENFRITSNVGHNIVKHKWNSAIRETEALAKILAIEENTTYSLVSSYSEKEGFYHVSGSRTWESKEGKTVVFTIVKE